MTLETALSTSPTPPFPALYTERKVHSCPLPYSSQVLPAQAGSDRDWGSAFPLCHLTAHAC